MEYAREAHGLSRGGSAPAESTMEREGGGGGGAVLTGGEGAAQSGVAAWNDGGASSERLPDAASA